MTAPHEMPVYETLPPDPLGAAIAWAEECDPGMHDELFEILRGPDPTLEAR